MSEKQPGTKLADNWRSGRDVERCRRWNSEGGIPTRREKRVL